MPEGGAAAPPPGQTVEPLRSLAQRRCLAGRCPRAEPQPRPQVKRLSLQPRGLVEFDGWAGEEIRGTSENFHGHEELRGAGNVFVGEMKVAIALVVGRDGADVFDQAQDGGALDVADDVFGVWFCPL
jgi:hypothetical protein